MDDGEVWLEEPLPAFMTMLAAFSFLAAPVWNARVLETKRSKFMAGKLIRVLPQVYVRGMLALDTRCFYGHLCSH